MGGLPVKVKAFFACDSYAIPLDEAASAEGIGLHKLTPDGPYPGKVEIKMFVLVEMEWGDPAIVKTFLLVESDTGSVIYRTSLDFPKNPEVPIARGGFRIWPTLHGPCQVRVYLKGESGGLLADWPIEFCAPRPYSGE